MKSMRQLGRDEHGATLIEFAIVAPIFFFLIFCIIELGLLLFSQVALESATMQVSRSASICNKGGTGGSDCASIVRRLITERTRGLINGESVRVSANTLAAGGAAAAPDICLTDPPSTPPSGQCTAGKYIDKNNNGTYDGPGSLSVGNAGDLVEIRVTYPWRMLIPSIARLYGNADGVVLLSASTIIKNEPQ